LINKLKMIINKFLKI